MTREARTDTEREWIEVSGRSVAEATAEGLKRLGLGSAEEAEVEVLDEAQRGLLGVLGGREARVRLRRRFDRLEALRALAGRIVACLELEGAEVSVGQEADGYARVTINGPGLGILIGRRGETLDSLQYLLNLASTRMPGDPQRVIFDVDGYRDRRRQTLERLAERVAERVRRTGQEVVLEPMTPQERKVIHLAISGEPDLVSESRGEEPLRRVAIRPGVRDD